MVQLSLLLCVLSTLLGFSGVLSLPTVASVPSSTSFWHTSQDGSKNTYNITTAMMAAIDDFVSSSNVTSFTGVMKKLHHGDDVNIMVVGGSFTAGKGCYGGYICAWVTRFVKWLQEVYPDSAITLLNRATPSTTSFFGLHFIEQESRVVDLLLVDFSLNDHYLAMEKSRVVPLHIVTEQIIRTAYHRNAAVLYIDEVQIDTATEEAYRQILDAYSVPLLSYHRIIADDLRIFKPPPEDPRAYPPQWSAPLHYEHPAWSTHVLLAQSVAYFFVRVAEQLHRYPQSDFHLRFLLPPAIFDEKDQSALHDNAVCSPALTVMSSLHEHHHSVPFEPYQVVNSKKQFNYYSTWKYESDLPQKPKGWISYSSRNSSDDSRLAFHVSLMRGDISITYLQTYHNAGRLEIWLSHHDFTSNAGKEKLGIGCCNNTKPRLYPTHQYAHNSYSAWIDTYSNVNRVSEVITKTFRFAYRGTFLLNIQHVRSSDEEFLERGGDKVKILGVRSC